MVRSPWLRVYPMRLYRAFRTRFRLGSVPEGLSRAAQGNSPAHSAIGTLSPVFLPPKGQTSGSNHCVGARFQVLLTPLTGVLFIFRSRYLFSRIQTGFPVSGPTWEHRRERGLRFRIQGYHPLWPIFPDGSASVSFCNSPDGPARPSPRVPQPRTHNARGLIHAPGLGWSPFARRYSGSRISFLSWAY